MKELRKLLQSEIGEVENGYCPNCDNNTSHTLTLYDPDSPAGLKVWECDKCGELIEVDSFQ